MRTPKGMVKRGRSYYKRLREGYRDEWINLGRDKAEAIRRFRRLTNGESQPISRIKVGEAADQWLETYIATNRSNSKDRKLVAARVQQFLKPYMGYKLLGKVTKEDLRTYRLWLEKRKKPLSPQSVRHILSDARCFLYWAEDAGFIEIAPIPRKLLPRLQERPPDYLSNIEVEKLVRLPEPYGFPIRFALATGLRWSELCRAQASHIEGEWLIVSETKSKKLRRIPLSEQIRKELSGRAGRLVPFSVNSSGAFTRMVVKLSGIADFRTHRLRHTYGHRWVMEGGSLAALQQIFGHSTLTMTQRYARPTDDFVAQEARRVRERSVA